MSILELSTDHQISRVTSPSAFNSIDMAEVASDASGHPAAKDGDSEGVNNWVAPVKYDYEKYLSTVNRDLGNLHLAPTWGSAGQRYEWDNEYGDVGPAVEELEAILFADPYRVRGGANLGQLNTQVIQESSSRVAPVFDVSSFANASFLRLLTGFSSKKLVSTQSCLTRLVDFWSTIGQLLSRLSSFQLS